MIDANGIQELDDYLSTGHILIHKCECCKILQTKGRDIVESLKDQWQQGELIGDLRLELSGISFDNHRLKTYLDHLIDISIEIERAQKAYDNDDDADMVLCDLMAEIGDIFRSSDLQEIRGCMDGRR